MGGKIRTFPFFQKFGKLNTQPLPVYKGRGEGGGGGGGGGKVPKNYVKIERFVTKVNSFWALAIVAKLSVLDVSASHGYVSEQ